MRNLTGRYKICKGWFGWKIKVEIDYYSVKKWKNARAEEINKLGIKLYG